MLLFAAAGAARPAAASAAAASAAATGGVCYQQCAAASAALVSVLLCHVSVGEVLLLLVPILRAGTSYFVISNFCIHDRSA